MPENFVAISRMSCTGCFHLLNAEAMIEDREIVKDKVNSKNTSNYNQTTYSYQKEAADIFRTTLRAKKI